MIKIKFPYNLKSTHNECTIQTEIETKNNIISFTLPFKLKLKTLNNYEAIVLEDKDDYIYAFEFKKTHEKREFIENPEVCCFEDFDEKDVMEIEQDANNKMIEYELIESKKRKKTTFTDEDGWTIYK